MIGTGRLIQEIRTRTEAEHQRVISTEEGHLAINTDGSGVNGRIGAVAVGPSVGACEV